MRLALLTRAAPASWRRLFALGHLVAATLSPLPVAVVSVAAVSLAAPVAHAAPLPTRTGRVTDAAGVLKPEGKAAIDRELAAIEQRTSVEVAAVVIRTLGGQSIESYSYELIRAWQLGKAGPDRGALMLVTLDERKVRIETGKGVRGHLPDAVCSDILREQMIPRLKQNDIAGSLLAGAQTIGQRLDAPAPAPGMSTRTKALLAIGVGALGLMWSGLILVIWHVYLKPKKSTPQAQGR